MSGPQSLQRRRPIVAGCRVRHILGAEGVCREVHGLQCLIAWHEGGEELVLAGFLEGVPGSGMT